MVTRAFSRASKPAAGLLCGLILAAGCRSTTPQPPPEATVQPVPESTIRQVAAADPDLMLFGVDPGLQVAAPQARPTVSLQQQTFSEVGRDFDPDVDAAGKQVVFASTRHSAKPNLYLQATQGRAVTQLTNDPGSEIQPRFSPDGKKVAFASDRAGQWDVYVLDLGSRTTAQLTHNEDHELAPSWSPDGAWLAYCRLSAATGAWEMWLLSVVEGTERCIGPGLLPRFSPDGSQIAFQRSRERDGMLFSIWTVKLVNGEPGWPTEVAAAPDAALICPSWSPDGQRIAYCRVPAQGLAGGEAGLMGRPSQTDIYLVGVDGAEPVRLTDGGASFAPCFSSEGRLYFSADRDGRERIWSLKTAGPAKPNLASTAMGEPQ